MCLPITSTVNINLMTIGKTIFLCFLMSTACRFTFTREQSILIEVRNSGGEVGRSNSIVDLSVLCSSRTSDNILLYGILSNLIFDIDQQVLCDTEKVGAGLCIQVFDSADRRVPAEIDLHRDGYNRYLPTDVFIDKLARNRDKFLKGTKVLSFGDTLMFNRTIDLRNFHLKPGYYELQVVYYSGKGIYDDFVVGHDRVKQDEILYEAKPFQGCAISNRIQLVVQ